MLALACNNFGLANSNWISPVSFYLEIQKGVANELMEALELDPASEEIRSVFTDCTILKKKEISFIAGFHSGWYLQGGHRGSDERCSLWTTTQPLRCACQHISFRLAVGFIDVWIALILFSFGCGIYYFIRALSLGPYMRWILLFIPFKCT